MLIEVDFAGEVPIYSQIRDQIVIGIAAGLLQSGEELPSVRRLAADIGVNLHTVNKAYALLRDEGYVQMDRRSGARIAPEMERDPDYEEVLIQKLYPIMAEALCHRFTTQDMCDMAKVIYDRLEKKGEQENG